MRELTMQELDEVAGGLELKGTIGYLLGGAVAIGGAALSLPAGVVLLAGAATVFAVDNIEWLIQANANAWELQVNFWAARS